MKSDGYRICQSCIYNKEKCCTENIERCAEYRYNPTWTKEEIEAETDCEKTGAVNHPNHYNQGGIECIDAIRESMKPEGFQDFCKGNVMKYIWRWREKGGIEDLKKACEFYRQSDELYPMDESAKVFIERCEDFIKNGLPKIWDGVYTMQSK